ncbi:MAG: hypothetical protein IPM69_00470 [Ignavibacteria bacterium]|nr:hypothetical protein [Ignavibacteria bacterium]
MNTLLYNLPSKMRRILLIALFLSLPSLSYSQIATTTVNTQSVIMNNPKLLLGITYDCRSSLSSPNGLLGYHTTKGTFIPGIDSLFKDFPMSTLRYPANGITVGFDWKKSIGPIQSRIPQQILGPISTTPQVMEFGFDEFMAMTAARGVHPRDVQIMVPIYDKSTPNLTSLQQLGALDNVAMHNADWVEYANAPNDGTNPGGGTDWGAIRAANGHPEPYSIKIWNMGNEPYMSGEFGSNGVNGYVSTIIPIIDAMRSIDPTIQISVTVPANANSSWVTTVLNSSQLAGKMYAINAHAFLTEQVVNGSVPQGVNTAEKRIKELAIAAKSKGYVLIMGDQAHYIPATPPPTQAEQDLAMQWQGAHMTTELILAMSQISNLERSNYWVYGLTSSIWHPIRKNSDGSFSLLPVAAMYKRLSSLMLDNSLSVTSSSPTASDNNPYSVRSSAFGTNDASKVNVITMNRDKTSTIPFQLSGMNGYSVIASKLLTTTGLTAEVISESTIAPDANGVYSLPPMSILVVQYVKTGNTPPIVTYSATSQTTLCSSSDKIQLTGGAPLGGVYSGMGVMDGYFYPSQVGQGRWKILYTFTDANGLWNSDSAFFTVLPKPKVTFTVDVPKAVCFDASPIKLTGGSPLGGTYSGTGVKDGMFSPSLGSAGIKRIYYTYTDSNGCSNQDSTEITVYPATSSELNITSAGTFTLNGVTYTSSGKYVQHVRTSNGCDSTIFLTLTLGTSTAEEFNATEHRIIQVFTRQGNNSVIALDCLKNSPDARLEVYSILGQRIYTSTHSARLLWGFKGRVTIFATSIEIKMYRHSYQ